MNPLFLIKLNRTLETPCHQIMCYSTLVNDISSLRNLDYSLWEIWKFYLVVIEN